MIMFCCAKLLLYKLRTMCGKGVEKACPDIVCAEEKWMKYGFH